MSLLEIDDNLSIEYDVFGHGPPLLLIQGLGNQRSVWADMVDGLTEHFMVLTIELRGYAGCAPAQSFTIADLACDLLRCMDMLDIGGAHIFGHSQGGFIALEMALASPERVFSLILGGSASYTDEYGRHLLRHWRTILSEAGPARFNEALFLWNFSPYYFLEHPRQMRILQKWVGRTKLDSKVYQQHNLACENYDTRDRLHCITMPTLLIGGSQDIIMGERHIQLLQELIPHARLAIIPKAGHQFFLENPEETLSRVSAFLPVWGCDTGKDSNSGGN